MNPLPLLRRFKSFSFHSTKLLYRRLRFRPGENQHLMFIVGCQRSGTTMTAGLFSRDFSVQVYREFSPEVCDSKKRLKSPSSLAEVLKMDRARLIVLKPLIDSQRIPGYLAHFDRSIALWLYRHYKDVTNSYLQKFGVKNGINEFQPLLAGNFDDWRCESISLETREQALAHYSEKMSAKDLTALGWWVRNKLFFDLKFDSHPRVLICSYESICSDPLTAVRRIYRFLGLAMPSRNLTRNVESTRIGRGKRVELSPRVEALCSDLWRELEDHRAKSDRHLQEADLETGMIVNRE